MFQTWRQQVLRSTATMLVCDVMILFLCTEFLESAEISYRSFRSFQVWHSDVRLDVPSLVTLLGSDPLTCMRMCIARPGCRSFNIDLEGRCELLAAFYCEASTHLVSQVGCRYFDLDTDPGIKNMKSILTYECIMEGKCSGKCVVKKIGQACTVNANCNSVTDAECRAGVCQCSVQFAYKKTADSCVTKVKKIGQACTVNANCLNVTDAECRDGVCQCSIQFAYNKTADSCVTKCHEYGNTFSVRREYGLSSYNNVTLVNTHLDKCRDACVQSVVCRSFEYSVKDSVCYLSSFTCIDFPQRCRSNIYFDFYIRNCK